MSEDCPFTRRVLAFAIAQEQEQSAIMTERLREVRQRLVPTSLLPSKEPERVQGRYVEHQPQSLAEH